MRRHTRSRRWPNNLRVPPYRALHPADAEAWFMLGTLRGRSGDHAGAEAALRQALAVFPEFAQACLNLGHALELHGNGAEAEACYLRAVALKPDLAEAHEALGRLCQQRGEWPAAEEHYQVALRLHPAATGAALALAALLTRRGRLSDALAALEQAWHHDRTRGELACALVPVSISTAAKMRCITYGTLAAISPIWSPRIRWRSRYCCAAAPAQRRRCCWPRCCRVIANTRPSRSPTARSASAATMPAVPSPGSKACWPRRRSTTASAAARTFASQRCTTICKITTRPWRIFAPHIT